MLEFWPNRGNLLHKLAKKRHGGAGLLCNYTSLLTPCAHFQRCKDTVILNRFQKINRILLQLMWTIA